MDETYIGRPFRQLSRRIRLQRGKGHPDKVSERPYRERKDGSIVYLDSDEQPTLITFDERDVVDIPALLQSGAIVPWNPPTPPAPVEVVKPAKPDRAEKSG